MKIYTKTGDKGTTRLVDGTQVDKFNPRVEAYGTVDELNSQLGVIRSLIGEKKVNGISELNHHLEKIQNHLFNVGSLLATENKDVFKKLPQVSLAQIEMLEKWIDTATAELPALKNFILPSGSLIASHMHVARTICRRAERHAVEIYRADTEYNHNSVIYLNRLSDLLFTWARFTNLKLGLAETVWKKDE